MSRPFEFNFAVAPIIGLGLEIFQDSNGVTGLDFEAVNLLRRVVLPLGVFRFVVLPTPAQAKEYNEMLPLFSDIGLASLRATGESLFTVSPRKAIEYLQLYDFIYAPKVFEELKAQYVLAEFKRSKACFLYCLEHFSRYHTAYSIQTFNQIAQQRA